MKPQKIALLSVLLAICAVAGCANGRLHVNPFDVLLGGSEYDRLWWLWEEGYGFNNPNAK